MKIEDLKNKKVGVLGLGEENIALTKFLFANEIWPTICDQKSREELGEYYEKIKDLPVAWRLGEGYLDDLADFDLVFRTPGLPYFHPKIQQAKKKGVEISSEIKLFFDLCPSPIIGITGTKGKGTTASLTYEILKKVSSGQGNVYLGGNIGNPPVGFLDKLKPDDIVVLELSSFQLQDLDRSPHTAVVLDIKVDHLDYHKDEKEYIEAKENIVKFQTKDDFAIINADYFTSVEFASLTAAKVYWFSRRKSVDAGCWVKNGEKIILRIEDKDIEIAKTSEITLRGEHNWENICAAITVSYLTGADVDSIKDVVKNFKGLEHRLELVANIDGINFYNDSFATTPDTAIAAIKSFKEPVILLVGGSDKGADYSELAKTISNSSVKAVINIGLTGQKIIEKIPNFSTTLEVNKNIQIIDEIQTMPQAVKLAKKIAQAGDAVVLSPASASFDNYKNYKQRGEIFRKEVLK